MRHERSRTKLIATRGPSTAEREVLRRMFLEGIDVCRLNFSHGTRREHEDCIRMVRELNRELNSHVAILADLQGPKLRIGEVEGGEVLLREGDEFALVNRECIGTRREAYLNYGSLPADVEPGDSILIDDGRIELSVVDTDGTSRVTAMVVHGGTQSSRKGVNLPSTKLSVPSLTEKDRTDAAFALEHEVDWIALSFVRSASDMMDLRRLVEKAGSGAGLVAKIEKPQALDDIEEIVRVSDAVMVARGDLGVEVDFHRVPMIQKTIVDRCIMAATPVIIATQMMESMIESHRPTRANAVLDGADCLMLSGETAVGRYPEMVIRNMQKIIDWTEEHDGEYFRGSVPPGHSTESLPDSICYSAVQMARQTGAASIVTFTHSGYTAVRISSYRPRSSIFAFTMNRDLLPMLSMVWGVRAFYLENTGQIEDYVDRSMNFLREAELAGPGDTIVHVGSIPLQEHGKTNMLKLSYIES